MLSVSITIGHLPGYQRIVRVAKTIQLNMPSHAPKGGFPSIRHNEIRDLTANLLTEVCNDVSIEPDLQGDALPTNCNQCDGARLDIAANGFWGGRYERTYFDFRVFNPHAPTNRSIHLASCYRYHENLEKKKSKRGSRM